MRHRPDDVLRAERRVAAEEHLRVGRRHGLRVDLGHVPLVELDADVALDPRERVLLADRDQHVVARHVLVGLARRDRACGGPCRRTRPSPSRTRTPVSLPFSWVNSFGTMKLRIGMPSCIASSFSHGEAFISSKPERTITLTSSPPSRREERQQSIAVLPPPSTMTRLPILLMWPNETLDSQSMPMWMLAAASLRPGMSRSRPRGAPRADEDRVPAFGEQRLEAVDRACRRGTRCRGRGCSRTPRRSRSRAGGISGSACASCRPPSGPGRTPRRCSRAARGRARP